MSGTPKLSPRTRTISIVPGRRRVRWGATLSVVLLAGVGLVALVSPMLSDAATRQSVLDALLPPGSPGHPLGTDELGRDVLMLTLAGTGSAVVGPVIVAAGSMTLAVLLGTIAGYVGGFVDGVIGRGVDVLLALPVMLVALVVAGVFGAGYWVTVVLLIVLFCPSDIRIVRAGVTEQAPRPYVEAAQMLSLSSSRIMFRYVVPNTWPLILTNVTLNVGIALVALSSLSFLGVGVAPGTPDWGRQISDGRGVMGDNAAMLIVPAVLIILVTMAINVLGDHLGTRLRERGIQ
ncbi:ABC transporter permease [Agromyces mediolanus]|uniref:ABC transporter permease n=1 Tax=Agromyces mediolanus TaxID=41986 RepID=UPI002042154D|nr:ABC transporter permease [Agromyces mediolanus]MCM3656205.1 ABC transporter permease [Agromyces mediolanus]